MKTTMIGKRHTAVMMALVLAGALFGSAQSTAGAAMRPYISSSSADMFWCTSQQAMCATQTVTKGIPYQTPLRMVCWRDDRDPFNSQGRSRWFYSVLDNGQEGYLWSAQVGGQVWTPSCSSVNWIGVSDWATGRDNGQVTRWISKSADGPFVPQRTGNYWSGWCLAFAGDAWAVGGGAPSDALSYPTAIGAWNAFAAKGQVDRTHRPPRGAMVFFNWTTSGHVAISLGNWRVISTQGNEPQTLPIYDFNFGPDTPGYLGWAMPVAATGAGQSI